MKPATDWPAASVEMRAIASLVPYAKNSRTHSAAQVEQIAASMSEWGWTNPVLVDEDGMVIAGHGRILAAQKLGLADAPVMTARGWSTKQKQAYVLADNQLALNAGWDVGRLAIELGDLKGGFDMSLVGFSDGQLKRMLDQTTLDASPKLDGLSYAVIIRCKNEDDQLRILGELETQGLTCEALIS